MEFFEFEMSVEQQVDLFLPSLTEYIDEITVKLSELKKQDYSVDLWQYIINAKKSGHILNYHTLIEAWDNIQQFFCKKVAFYAFIEEKTKGLTEKSFIIWTFLSPKVAGDYFKYQLKIPATFNEKSIFPLPYPKIATFFHKAVDKIILNRKAGISSRIHDILKYLVLADRFLDEDGIEKFEQFVLEKGLDLINQEVAQLQNDHENIIAGEKHLEGRSKVIFLISQRILKLAETMDTEYLKKLLSEKPEERIKGLLLSKKRLLDLSMQI